MDVASAYSKERSVAMAKSIVIWRKYVPQITYTVITLLVLAPLLRPGYVLTLDMVFTPQIRMPSAITNDYVLQAALHILNEVIPSQIIEKVLLLGIFFLAGFGMNRFVRSIAHAGNGAYVAGIFYTINPFTYDRLMAGQYLVLFGYALLPFFLYALRKFVRSPGLRTSLWLVCWSVIASIVSIHSIGFMLLIAGIVGGCSIWSRRKTKGYIQQLVRCSVLVIFLFLVASSYWLIPIALGHGGAASEVAGYGGSGAFATVGDSFIGKFANVIRLQGFWLEARNMFVLPETQIPLWGLLMLLIWVCVGCGVVSLWKSGKRLLVVSIGAMILLGVLLSTGLWNEALINALPLFAVYREPQKFVTLVALGYSIFIAFGVDTILRVCAREMGNLGLKGATILAWVLPLVITETMLWGCHGQLQASTYPADWFTVNTILDHDHQDFHVLFLPWHFYMYFGFVGRIIGNPAPTFFDKPVIVSDNPELPGAVAINPTTTTKRVDMLLPDLADGQAMGTALAPLGIKYIVLAREYDYGQYAYLNTQHDLRLVYKGVAMDVYRNMAYRGQ